MRLSKKEQQQQIRFSNAVVEYLKSIGAEQKQEYTLPNGFHPHYIFRLETRYGSLELTVASNCIGGPGTVFTRFDEPQRASPSLDCNPYSGKWNHHYFDSWSVEEAVKNFKWHINSILTPYTGAAMGEGSLTSG
jgi:hypothetical protein